MKRKHRKLKVLLSAFLVLCIFWACVFPTFAYNENNYENAGVNFLKSQYSLQGINYSSLSKKGAINLYDNHNTVIAKMLIVKRDEFLDYVVLDFLTDRIDEFGFDQKAFINTFQTHNHIMYAGLLNYAYYDHGILTNLNGEQIEDEKFFALMDAFTQTCSSIPHSTKDGFGGFSSWTEIKTLNNERPKSSGLGGTVTNNDWSYLDGFSDNGTDADLTMYSQTKLNRAYNAYYDKSITGTCAITAITNMFIYYHYCGFDSLYNDSVNDTFAKALQKN